MSVVVQLLWHSNHLKSLFAIAELGKRQQIDLDNVIAWYKICFILSSFQYDHFNSYSKMVSIWFLLNFQRKNHRNFTMIKTSRQKKSLRACVFFSSQICYQ